MPLEFWNPIQRLDELKKRSDQMWQQLLAEVSSSSPEQAPVAFHPEADLVETKHDFRYYLSIPGLVEDDILIDIEGRSLTVSGERIPPYDAGHRGPNVQEWQYGFFCRQFELPAAIAIESLRARYDAGVLTIVAQKITEFEIGTTEESS